MIKKEATTRLKLHQSVLVADKLKRRFCGILLRAHRESKTFDWILDTRAAEVFSDPYWGRLPQWAQMQVREYTRAQLDALSVLGLLKWQHWLDGQRIESRDVPAGRWGDLTSRTEWAHSGEPYRAVDELSGEIWTRLVEEP